MKTAIVFGTIAVALALQTTLARFTVGSPATVDLVLVAVVYAALAFGPVVGLFAGTLGGLAQDALSAQIIGVSGLAKTLVGFVSGVVGSQFIVSGAVPRFIVFLSASLLHTLCFRGVHAMLPVVAADSGLPTPRGAGLTLGAVFWQALGNALIGLLVFQAAEWLPGLLQRRQMRYRR
ncbi:MAG TPA: rod shape-determining protein MreD [Vicinamibacterales bacterium]|jgi:rod shape-determining protein MreD|nr:rod shape-determining protein MreD [Vicinamibacterales bacterium]